MLTVAEIESNNKIDENEFSQMTHIMFHSLILHPAVTDKSLLEKKSLLLTEFTDFLNKMIRFKVTDRNKKVELIDFIEKLNLQRDLIDLQKGLINMEDAKRTADNLGRKAQTSFETEL
jgi:hypothetical protein